MSFSYKPLWDLLQEENISKMEFASAIDISNTTLAKLSKNEPVNLNVINKICNLLEFRIENVVQHIPDIVLTPLQTGKPLEIGSIITTSNTEPSKEKDYTAKYHVIIKMTTEHTLVGDAYRYAICPILVIPRSPFCLYFENIAIDGQLMHGWIDLSEIVPLANNSSITIMGKMSSHIVKKINEFETAVDKILSDD